MRGLQPTLGPIVAVLFAACSTQSAAPATTPSPLPTAAPSAAPTDAPTATAPPPGASSGAPPTALEEAFEPGATAAPDAIRVQLGTCCSLSFVPTDLTVAAGTVKLFLVNLRNPKSPFDHDIQIGTELGKALASSPVIKHATWGVLTIEDMPAGKYVYWCAVNNHYQQGMVGHLTVTD
jgi:plastocyanin